MSVNIIIIGVFFFVLVLAAFFYRGASLDKLPMLEGEKVLFEESGVRAEQGGAPTTAVFSNCIVRVTNMRIIIAQKMLLSKSYALRHVIVYNALSDASDLKTSLKKGYLNMKITKENLKLNDAGKKGIIRIEIPHTILTGNQYITYQTLLKEKYMKEFF
jgi:hypothetical protein